MNRRTLLKALLGVGAFFGIVPKPAPARPVKSFAHVEAFRKVWNDRVFYGLYPPQIVECTKEFYYDYMAWAANERIILNVAKITRANTPNDRAIVLERGVPLVWVTDFFVPGGGTDRQWQIYERSANADHRLWP